MNDGESREMLIACSDPLIYRLRLSCRLIIPYLLYIRPPPVIWSPSIIIFIPYSWYRLVKYSDIAEIILTTAFSCVDDLFSQLLDRLSYNTFTKYFKAVQELEECSLSWAFDWHDTITSVSIHFHYQQPNQWDTTASSRNCRPMARDIRGYVWGNGTLQEHFVPVIK